MCLSVVCECKSIHLPPRKIPWAQLSNCFNHSGAQSHLATPLDLALLFFTIYNIGITRIEYAEKNFFKVKIMADPRRNGKLHYRV